MVWHYIENGKQAGPVDEATFQSMVSSGAISGSTQVWRDGMPNWAPYGSVASAGIAAVPIVPGTMQCSECGNYFAGEDLVQIGDRAVCAACKPIAVQKLKEGVLENQVFNYAGFWIRFAAAFVDGLVMIPVIVVYFIVVLNHRHFDGARIGAQGLMYVIQISYSVLLIGKYGSTLGMMACGIRVVRPDGQSVSYLRALGRYFAALLSYYLILIGYIMIAFDEEKRSLHDRICDTRVVYK